jgi:hypothetical protein
LGGIRGGGGRGEGAHWQVQVCEAAEWWMAWGAAGPGTLPAMAVGTTSRASPRHHVHLSPRAADDRHGRAALFVPAGGPPGQPMELHGSAVHQHACENGQQPAGILVRGALRRGD